MSEQIKATDESVIAREILRFNADQALLSSNKHIKPEEAHRRMLVNIEQTLKIYGMRKEADGLRQIVYKPFPHNQYAQRIDESRSI